MKKVTCISYCLAWVLALSLLPGCLGSSSSSSEFPVSVNPSQLQPTMPAAVPGNIAFVSNDEAPVLRNETGEPIRQDNVSQGEVLHFEGFNEN